MMYKITKSVSVLIFLIFIYVTQTLFCSQQNCITKLLRNTHTYEATLSSTVSLFLGQQTIKLIQTDGFNFSQRSVLLATVTIASAIISYKSIRRLADSYKKIKPLIIITKKNSLTVKINQNATKQNNSPFSFTPFDADTYQHRINFFNKIWKQYYGLGEQSTHTKHPFLKAKKLERKLRGFSNFLCPHKTDGSMAAMVLLTPLEFIKDFIPQVYTDEKKANALISYAIFINKLYNFDAKKSAKKFIKKAVTKFFSKKHTYFESKVFADQLFIARKLSMYNSESTLNTLQTHLSPSFSKFIFHITKADFSSIYGKDIIRRCAKQYIDNKHGRLIDYFLKHISTTDTTYNYNERTKLNLLFAAGEALRTNDTNENNQLLYKALSAYTQTYMPQKNGQTINDELSSNRLNYCCCDGLYRIKSYEAILNYIEWCKKTNQGEPQKAINLLQQMVNDTTINLKRNPGFEIKHAVIECLRNIQKTNYGTALVGRMAIAGIRLS